MYVILTSKDPLRYFLGQGWTRVALKEFSLEPGEPSVWNAGKEKVNYPFDTAIHLPVTTPYSLSLADFSKEMEKVVGKEEVDRMWKLFRRKMTALFANWNLFEPTNRYTRVLREPNYGFHTFDGPCYDVYGLDVMIEHDKQKNTLNPLILEVNQGPGLIVSPIGDICWEVAATSKFETVGTIANLSRTLLNIEEMQHQYFKNEQNSVSFHNFIECHCNPKNCNEIPDFCDPKNMETTKSIISRIDIEQSTLHNMDIIVPPLHKIDHDVILEKTWKVKLQLEWMNWKENRFQCLL